MSWRSSWEVTAFVFEIFLLSQAVPLEHVVEVGVAAEVELVRALTFLPALLEEGVRGCGE